MSLARPLNRGRIQIFQGAERYLPYPYGTEGALASISCLEEIHLSSLWNCNS